jgi:hypothetical protein
LIVALLRGRGVEIAVATHGHGAICVAARAVASVVALLDAGQDDAVTTHCVEADGRACTIVGVSVAEVALLAHVDLRITALIAVYVAVAADVSIVSIVVIIVIIIVVVVALLLTRH